MKLEGRTALVTGGGGSIGRGITLCLAEEGAAVAVADIDLDRARMVAEEASKLGPRCFPLQVDVSVPEQIEEMTARVLKEFGRLDILVNNAGAGSRPGRQTGEPETVEDWDYVYKVNLRAYYLTYKAISPQMTERRYGKIINVASIAGRQGGGPWFLIPYRATKAAVINLSQSMAAQMAPYSVNVNAVCPGIVWSSMWEQLAAEIRHEMPGLENLDLKQVFDFAVAGTIAMQREQTPEDIGRAVAFLASDDAKNITGQALNVDGGAQMN